MEYVRPGTTPPKDKYFFSQVHGEDYMVGVASIRLASLRHTGAALHTYPGECGPCQQPRGRATGCCLALQQLTCTNATTS